MASKHVPSSLFGDTVQPESLTLFSSTSSDPFVLWRPHLDPDLAEDSGICLLNDASHELVASEWRDTETFSLRFEPAPRGSSSETVLHIQSPAIRNTFICSPPSEADELGIQLPCIAFQYKPIGSCRPSSLQVDIKDVNGREGIIRVSSFQSKPELYIEHLQGGSSGSHSNHFEPRFSRPLLHLPLNLAATPDQDETSLTGWQVLTLPLDRLAENLSNSSLMNGESGTFGSDKFGPFHSVTHVKIFANMRLRRVWCSRDPPNHDLPEFQVFS